MGTIIKERQGVNETILLVDDEQSLLDVTFNMLDLYAYRAIKAINAEAALECYEKGREGIDLVLLDLGMPGMSGQRCFKELLKIDPETKVIITTGYPACGKTKEMIDAGAAGFINKPYRFSALLKKIRGVLDN
jgi:DNA-binding NtrC family response regulator